MAPIIVPSIILGIALLAFLSVYADGASITGIIIGHIVLAIPYVVRTVSGVAAATGPLYRGGRPHDGGQLGPAVPAGVAADV